MKSSHVGLLLGALLGFALIVGGLGDMLIVALGAAIGWAVMRVLEGDLDLNELLRGRSGDRGNRSSR